MKPSEALLLNSMVCGHGVKVYISSVSGNRCALATIMLETKQPSLIHRDLMQKYHMFAAPKEPFDNEYHLENQASNLSLDIMTMNDCDGWTRPQIAIWLQQKEQEYGEIGPKQPIKLLTNQGEQHDTLTLQCNDDLSYSYVHRPAAVDGVYDLKS